MDNLLEIEEKISKYYDSEMNFEELINFEAKLINSKVISNLVNQRCWEYFKISNSIKLTKLRNKYKADMIVNKLISQDCLINFNSITSKRFNEHLRRLLLNIRWNNS